MEHIKNYGLDLEREELELRGDEWQFGASSPACIFAVPEKDREKHLPEGEIQRGKEDFMDCATRDYINKFETKFTYAYRKDLILPALKEWLLQNGYVVMRKGKAFVEFSDRFIAIKSGTTRSGNSLKNPIHAIHQYGLIPKQMYPAGNFDFDEYHDKTKLTRQMEELAREFKLRFPIFYEQTPIAELADLLKRDMVCIGVYAWPKINKNREYPKVGNVKPNHAVMAFALPSTYIFDNYPDDKKDGEWIKKLAEDYGPFYQYGYRAYVERQVDPAEIQKQLTFLQKAVMALKEIIDGLFPPHAYDVLPEELPMNQDAPKDEKPTLPSNREKLLAEAQKWLGKEASPQDKAPDELACVESLCNVMDHAGLPIPQTLAAQLSTAEFDKWIKTHKAFKSTPDLKPGNIICSPTGKGKTGLVSNGHVGVILEGGRIASNNSLTSLWDDLYTIDAWVARWREKGGYPIYIYEPIN